MSVLMVIRFTGVERERVGPAHEQVAGKVNELGKQMGAIHHDIYWSPSHSEVVVIDEWRSAEDAEKFWATDEFREALAEVGFPPPADVYVLERVEDTSLRF
jgi:heme-degrading monooxygenase HmoA